MLVDRCGSGSSTWARRRLGIRSLISGSFALAAFLPCRGKDEEGFMAKDQACLSAT